MSQFADNLVLPREVSDVLGRFETRRRRLAVLRAAGVAVTLLAAAMLVVAWIDRLRPLPPLGRAALLVASVALASVPLVRPLLAMLSGRFDGPAAAGRIERLAPALRDRLRTLVSQAHDRGEVRGSSAMLGVLGESARREVQQLDARALLPLSLARRSWLAAAGVIAVGVAMSLSSWLSLPTLLARQLQPFAEIAPVTWTRLSVLPGDVRLLQGQPLPVRVMVERLGDDEPVTLVSQPTGGRTSRVAMTRSGDGAYTHVIESVERELRYHVVAGDARSGDFTARVLRRPAIVKIDAVVTYPAHLDRPPLRVPAGDGRVTAPVGSMLEISVVATEPLSSATLSSGSQKLAASVGDDPRVGTVTLTLVRDATWQVSLVSSEGVPSDDLPALQLRATPDEAPVVRLPTDSIRARPSDRVLLPYQASDDHGLVELLVQPRINGRSAPMIAVAIRDDPRLQQGLLEIDLATLDLRLGDSLELRLRGRDGAGQRATSAACAVLITPHPSDFFDRRRVSLLRDATRQLDELRSLLAAPATQPTEAASPDRLAAAAEAARAAQASVLQATIDSPDAHEGSSLRHLLDELTRMEASLRRRPEARPAEALPSAEQAELLVERARSLAWASAARAALADLDSLDALAAAGPTTRSADSKRQLAEQWRRGLDDLPLDDDPARSRESLREAAAAMQSSAASMNVDELLRRFAAGESPEALADRLLASSRAEAMRRGGDVSRAGDLAALSRAVRSATRGRPGAIGPRAAVQRAWSALGEAQSVGATAAVARARRQLQAIASSGGEPTGELLQSAADEAARAGDALRDAADRQRALADVAEQLRADEQQILQQRLNADLDLSLSPSPAATRLLAALDALESAARGGSAAFAQAVRSRDQIEHLQDQIEAAEVERGPADWGLEAEPLREQAWAMHRQFERAMGQLDVRGAAEAVDALRPLAARATPIEQATRGSLLPAIRAARAAIDHGDATQRAAARGSLESAAQEVLGALQPAREAALSLDASAAARWHARRAATLAAEAASPSAIAEAQRLGGDAIARAADDASRAVMTRRLWAMPEMATLADALVDPSSSAAEARPRLLPPAALRTWGLLRDRAAADTSTPTRSTDPPGYEDPLRLYFQLLNRDRREAR
jgi:hypothetical protein